jgi:hypothetical protein
MIFWWKRTISRKQVLLLVDEVIDWKQWSQNTTFFQHLKKCFTFPLEDHKKLLIWIYFLMISPGLFCANLIILQKQNYKPKEKLTYRQLTSQLESNWAIVLACMSTSGRLRDCKPSPITNFRSADPKDTCRDGSDKAGAISECTLFGNRHAFSIFLRGKPRWRRRIIWRICVDLGGRGGGGGELSKEKQWPGGRWRDQRRRKDFVRVGSEFVLNYEFRIWEG